MWHVTTYDAMGTSIAINVMSSMAVRDSVLTSNKLPHVLGNRQKEELYPFLCDQPGNCIDGAHVS